MLSSQPLWEQCGYSIQPAPNCTEPALRRVVARRDVSHFAARTMHFAQNRIGTLKVMTGRCSKPQKGITMHRKRRRRNLLAFESKQEPILSQEQFAQRLGYNVAFSGAFIGAALLAGMAGYHFLENMEWIDSFANASMILSGMGPLAQPQTWWGKLFAGSFALYSGLVLIFAASLIFAPIFHRLLHKFHMEEQEAQSSDG